MRHNGKNIRLRLMGIIIFTAGLLGFIWFLLPLIMHRILNIGNATGLAVCAVLMLCGCLTNRIHILIKKLWKKRVGKFIFGTVSLLAAAVLILVIVETVFMADAACRTPEPGSTVVLLGCKVRGERPTLILKTRLDAACDYLEENPDSVCILSGGQGPDEAISEAECMYRYLTEKGISPDRLYKEEKSTSTRENLAFSKEIIDRNGLNPHIAIATNEFHEYRAGKIAAALGLDCAAVSGHTPAYLFAAYYVRELYGILYEWIL